MTLPPLPDLIAQALTYPQFADRLASDGQGRVVARFNGITLSSSFSPIYDLASYATAATAPSGVGRFGEEVGFEARLCAWNDATAAPLSTRDWFASIREDTQLVDLDRLSRALHALNFFGLGMHGLLFLNVHERLLKSVRYDHGNHFSSILLALGLNPGRIVIEIPEAASAHKTFLDYLAKSYQRYGFKIAANLSNAGLVMTVADATRLDFLKINARTALGASVVKPLVGYAQRQRLPIIFKHVDDEALFQTLKQYEVRYVEGAYFDAVDKP